MAEASHPAAEVCPDDRALTALIEGELSDDARGAIETHLDGCRTCRACLAEVGALLAPADQAPAVRRLGRFEIIEEAGRGGMGVVYRGWDPLLGREVALKRIRPDRADDEATGARQRILHEGRALARLLHPHVVVVFDVFQEGDEIVLATEYVAGATATEWIARGAPSWRERVTLYLQAGLGLAAMHAQGLTHRDVKPGNILVGPDGRARLGDFGLAVSIGSPGASGGTPAYMAPEQRSGGLASAAADQYALCVSLAEALLGERPAPDSSARTLEAAAAARWPWRAAPPRALWQALARGLAVDPDRRFPTIDVLLAILAAAGAPRRRRWPWVVAPAVAGALALATIGVWRSTRSDGVLVAAAGTPPAREPLPATRADGHTVADGTAAPRATTADAATADGTAAAVADRQAPAVDAPARSATWANEQRDASRGHAEDVGSANAPPPVVDPTAPAMEAWRLRAGGGQALVDRDGPRCLDLLDRADAIDPAGADAMTQTRASCELTSGRCRDGEARLRAFVVRALPGLDPDSYARRLSLMYCPPSTGSAVERLERLELQARMTPHSRPRCGEVQRWVASVDGALAGDADAAMARRLGGIWLGAAACWAGAGRCDQALSAVTTATQRFHTAAPDRPLPDATTTLASLDGRCAQP
ncbi:MAG: protein kinase [Myxococcales bacterium]|nr:protein kinase [Myxococcales bacterium]MBK7195106.1 protein kinase [Myxococcales bacterium]MBP6844007.1 protein kinase [Kofleriaceae bacterium]